MAIVSITEYERCPTYISLPYVGGEGSLAAACATIRQHREQSSAMYAVQLVNIWIPDVSFGITACAMVTYSSEYLSSHGDAPRLPLHKLMRRG